MEADPDRGMGAVEEAGALDARQTVPVVGNEQFSLVVRQLVHSLVETVGPGVIVARRGGEARNRAGSDLSAQLAEQLSLARVSAPCVGQHVAGSDEDPPGVRDVIVHVFPDDGEGLRGEILRLSEGASPAQEVAEHARVGRAVPRRKGFSGGAGGIHTPSCRKAGRLLHAPPCGCG